MTKKRIYIHVGPPKTGTSVLQYWLNNNKDWLNERGYFYPAHEVDSNNVSSGHKSLFLEIKPKTTKTIFNHSLFQNLLQEFELSRCQFLLLSSEFFFYQIPNFYSYAEQYDIKFIAYVRADLDLVESLYNQSVKRNRQVKPLAIRATLPSSYVDDLNQFISTFPSTVFSLRAYGNESVFSGQGIVNDFLSGLGIEVQQQLVDTSEKINLSYSFEALEFKRWLNKFTLNELEAEIDCFLQGEATAKASYTLIPSDVFNRYREQSIDKIKKLNEVVQIANFDNLVDYLENKPRSNYMHQDLYPQHLSRVVQKLAESNPILLDRLTNTLADQICSEVDRSHFQIIASWNNCLKKTKPQPKSVFIKALDWFNKRRVK